MESELLQTALLASMEVISEVLSIVNPMAFSRSGGPRIIVTKLAKAFNARAC
ncbi:hypothetical protein [Halioxenophilus sp. WMMB6]|uniref:hypothetical protein n=1 Tax=Halioxenophilus sp. WMMB6 TaxID=3073815 RepID=UPI00295EFAC0|nr:hypothetical protein [Halioxenophilus sp. WMMB6]